MTLYETSQGVVNHRVVMAQSARPAGRKCPRGHALSGIRIRRKAVSMAAFRHDMPWRRANSGVPSS